MKTCPTVCFFVRIYNQCESHSTIREQGLQFVEVIKELLQRLLEYRAILNDENKENRMSCTVNLLVGIGGVQYTLYCYFTFL